ncbi:MAG: signal recognition particle protein [Firmicutes bacterium]|jgi:signal recognition particle subunit SRP54|nr:signal recognition particle protein [Bacillota bacterium]
MAPSRVLQGGLSVFSNLTERLQATFKQLRSRGKLTDKDVDSALREVRLALLEADVNFKVVRDFTTKLRERAIGQEVLKSLSPAQQVIKIVNEELIALLGGSQAKLVLSSKIPATVMMVGLQGSGKTTTCAKLAALLKKQGKRPLLAAADIYRPAAIRQLQVLGEQIDVPVFSMGDKASPVDISRAAVEHARKNGYDVLIIDTAGRLHIDEELMDELESIRNSIEISDVLLAVDAMTGQEAVNVAEAFHKRLNVGGIVLTKLDGDARGGAALSIWAVTGCPIKYVTLGEKLDAIEPFHPERMASRILGMGDVLTLIEKAQATMDEEEAEKLAERMLNAQFTLEDFLSQMQQLKQMGPLDQLLGMIPGFSNQKALKGISFDDKQMKRVEAIIQSMTVEERRNPSIIDGSRRKRIAAGSGTRVQDVNRLLRQFEDTRAMLKKLGAQQKGGRRRRMPFFG